MTRDTFHCITTMKRSVSSLAVARSTLFALICAISGCHDFSKFDCFGTENGCREVPDALIVQSSDRDRGAPGAVTQDVAIAGEDVNEPQVMSGAESLGGEEIRACTEDGPLGLCARCLNGQIVESMSDDRCDDLPDCTQYYSYDIMNGDQCVKRSYRTGSRSCVGIGECVGPDDFARYCEPERSTSVPIEDLLAEAVRSEGCKRVDGCRDEAPPELINVPEGERCGPRRVCNGQGLCRDLDPRSDGCGSLSTDACDPDLLSDRCEFQTLTDDITPNCQEFCRSLSATCESAWAPGRQCERAVRVLCNGPVQSDRICVCRWF